MSGANSPTGTSAFTATELVNIRRYLGYPPGGTDISGFQSWRFNQIFGLMEWKLNNSSPEEITQTRTYLATLATLEAAIPAAADNLDTIQIAVLYQNPREVQMRDTLYNNWRRKFAGFLGIPTGPYITNANSSRIVI
jgi:hypothetical protein